MSEESKKLWPTWWVYKNWTSAVHTIGCTLRAAPMSGGYSHAGRPVVRWRWAVVTSAAIAWPGLRMLCRPFLVSIEHAPVMRAAERSLDSSGGLRGGKGIVEQFSVLKGRAVLKRRSCSPHTSARRADTAGVSKRYALLCVVVIVAISAGVRLADLGVFSSYVFDERYYAHDAQALLHGGLAGAGWKSNGMLSQSHPLFGDEVIAAGIAVLGNHPWGWRIMSALAGVALIALVYPLARRMLLRRSWAVVATGLTACDTLLIAQSRVGMLDSFVALWTATCVYCALRAVRAPKSRLWATYCGVAGGLAMSTKWSGAFAILAALVILLLWRRRGHVHLVDLAMAVLVLPGAVYILTYAPYFAAGHGFSQWLDLQRYMTAHGMSLHQPDANSSAPAQWVIDAGAIWYRWGLVRSDVRGLVALGNPLLWWGALVSLAALAAVAVRRCSRLLALPVFIVACLYVPWLAVDRTSYIYYMAPVVPFLAVALARGLSMLRPRVATAYAVATAAPTALWLPFLVSFPVPYAYYHAVMLLPAWR